MNRLPYLVLLLPPLFWSGNFIIGRMLGTGQFPITLSFWRWTLAGLILLPFVVLPMWRQRELIKQHWKILTLLAFLSVSTFNTLAYIALTHTTATNAMLFNTLIPVLILIQSRVLFDTQISLAQLLGIALSFSGVLIILSQFNLHRLMNFEFNRGDLWMLLAATTWALYSVLLKYKKPNGFKASSFLGITVLLGLIMLTPIYLLNPLQEQAMQWTKINSLSLMYIALFPSVLAYLAWTYGISQLGAATAGQYLHLMPFFGALMAVFFLGEELKAFHGLSALFIASGLYLSLRSQQNQ